MKNCIPLLQYINAVRLTHVVQGYITGTEAIICLPQCQWCNPQEIICKQIQLIHHQQWLNQIDGLVQDCSISSALAMEILQSCTKPSKSAWKHILWARLYPSPCRCRPEWGRAADYIAGGIVRWKELSDNKTSDQLVEVLLQEIAGGGDSGAAGAEYFDGKVNKMGMF